MFILKAEQSFDSAHFLSGYNGKCSNIHGHRWRVIVEIKSDNLIEGGQQDGMIVDFGDLKKDLKEIIDFHDHALIIQKDTMRKETLKCLLEDEYKVIEVDFRPTAENFSYYFYNLVKNKGHKVKTVSVYETPTNCATYEE
ncbi:6-carboxytetrahydropterin synthase QueD [Clostridium sp.]|uniref:6-carboxytetrahydropterin synthase QueD n=1 Tax=Clostridium sp. TaxID=1506 RepID=UPI0032169561